MNENINKVHQIVLFYKIILLMRICLETLSLGDSLYGVHTMSQNDRSSRFEMFCRKCVLRNFAKFTEKHLCQSLFLNKVEALAQVFSCEFCEIFKNTFFYRTQI